MIIAATVAACSAPDLTELPTGSVDAVVLLAEISPGAVTVGGTVTTPQHLDLDAGSDDRYGFRYRVVDSDGDTLYERSTVGPVLVEAFLDYYSVESGVDILGSIPTLGRFPVHVPVLDDAEQVLFEVRDDASGGYALRGAYDLSRVEADDQGLETDIVLGSKVLHGGGDSAHRLDLVIVGDGYTVNQMDKFARHAKEVVDELLSEPPYSELADGLNIVRVDVVSEETGASYDCRDCTVRNTAFGSIFALELVNRITGAGYDSRAMFQADQWRVARAISAVPWDAVLVLVNSDQYGGMAVHYASATTGQPEFARVAIHELGHSLALLGDEYVFDACIRSQALGLPENVAEERDDVPWGHWVGDEGIDAYEGAWNCPELFRPAKNCMMKNHNKSLCAVCQELVARRVLRHTDPVDTWQVDGRMLRPTGPWIEDVTLKWAVDGDEPTSGPAIDGVDLRGMRGQELEVSATLNLDQVRDAQGDLTETYRFPLE